MVCVTTSEKKPTRHWQQSQRRFASFQDESRTIAIHKERRNVADVSKIAASTQQGCRNGASLVSAYTLPSMLARRIEVPATSPGQALVSLANECVALGADRAVSTADRIRNTHGCIATGGGLLRPPLRGYSSRWT